MIFDFFVKNGPENLNPDELDLNIICCFSLALKTDLESHLFRLTPQLFEALWRNKYSLVQFTKQEVIIFEALNFNTVFRTYQQIMESLFLQSTYMSLNNRNQKTFQDITMIFLLCSVCVIDNLDQKPDSLCFAVLIYSIEKAFEC